MVAGPGRLGLIHANDSRDVAGARKDRQANIGADPFAAFSRHPATAGVRAAPQSSGPSPGSS